MTSENAIGLPLESERWKTLEHAFGSSDSTLELLRQLRLLVEECAACDATFCPGSFAIEFYESKRNR